MGLKDERQNIVGDFILNKTKLKQKIAACELTCGVVGLGYVGLPLAVEKAKAGYRTIGFDVLHYDQRINADATILNGKVHFTHQGGAPLLRQRLFL